MATLILRGLAGLGVEVDCFLNGGEEDLPTALHTTSGLRFIRRPVRWGWDHWYSRSPLLAFLTGLGARAGAHLSLANQVAAHHRSRRYNVIYQFSQIELFRLRRYAAELPPIVLHPEVHAAGELRWHRRESALARRCERRRMRVLVQATLTARAEFQRRDLRLAKCVIAPSQAFARHLASDYRLPADLFEVIPNPIDLDRFRPPDPFPARPEQPLTLLFVSRLSVRKGVEMVTRLSHRLADLEGNVRIRMIGGPSLWSDYRGLLHDLNPAIGTYVGEVASIHLTREYHAADLLIQPSHYEPFALTVGEALACGLPVVGSDEVGALEEVSSRCCSVFPAGDLDLFERSVRDLVKRIRMEGKEAIGQIARSEAARLFAPESIAAAVATCLHSTATAAPLVAHSTARAAQK